MCLNVASLLTASLSDADQFEIGKFEQNLSVRLFFVVVLFTRSASFGATGPAEKKCIYNK